jgi:DNA-binding FadR family transcriptional regulator
MTRDQCEAGLLERYSVSRTVPREAMQVVSAKGMIDSRQRRGTTVRPRADWNQLDQTLLRSQHAVRSYHETNWILAYSVLPIDDACLRDRFNTH